MKTHIDHDPDFDAAILDATSPAPTKKRTNSKAKGSRVELALVKLLTARFGRSFSRSVGSGNRWSQVAHLPQHARDTYTGDICSPVGFLWVLECKGGYDDADIGNLFAARNATIDSFLKQSLHDAEASGRLPLVAWKRSRRPWVALLRETDAPPLELLGTRLHYGTWVMVNFLTLLASTSDEFWFE